MSTYQRKIENKPAKVIPLSVQITDLTQWLQEKAKEYGLVYLLAHADDGVIWGRIDTDGTLLTSYNSLHLAVISQKDWDNDRIEAAKKTLPELRLITLQQARLFCETGELLIWKDGDGHWQGRVIRNVQDGEKPDDSKPFDVDNEKKCYWSESFDEPQLLWGTHGTELANGFTLLEDGAQGLRHAVPLKLALDDQSYGKVTNKPKLCVRHYLACDEQGQAYIALSRLVNVVDERNCSPPHPECKPS